MSPMMLLVKVACICGHIYFREPGTGTSACPKCGRVGK